MSDCDVGFIVMATRQNDGSDENAAPPRPPPRPGGVNAPAATVCAVVTVVSGSDRDARLSQVAASLTPAVTRTRNATQTNRFIRTSIGRHLIPADCLIVAFTTWGTRHRSRRT